MIWTAAAIADLRRRLHLSQALFGQLFGVHPMTVSKWERGQLTPNAYQIAMMDQYRLAAKQKAVPLQLEHVLLGAGIAAAIFLLLKAARG
jgi:transcriptional regulator with XRE-family HTH domain